MLNRIFSNPSLRVLAIFGLSIFSIIATAFGFRLLIGENNSILAWIAALSVQVILVGAALLIAHQEERKRKVAGLLIYIIAVVFSISGSFFTFDSWLSQFGRSSRSTYDILENTARYAEDSLKAVASRKAILEQELAKIERLIRVCL